ncbi:MAG: Flp pilus assembly complex ATPase component TadA [Clostridia bacterium]|nr:Flp pilus assembly complex ATPase component TadA [Clostridia bacterium]MBQ4243496.1 Flp pilus assembly complex ATPase component TadA [Clostridia bacterium]MBR6005124.1 Flp pilus assembly complex ATPase component TadA [Clostridia bacterium]
MTFNRDGNNLGDILLANGKVTQEKLQQAYEESQKTGKNLSECLRDLKLCDDESIARAQGELLDVPYISLRAVTIPPEIIRMINGRVLRQHNAAPVEFLDGNTDILVVALANPLDMVAIDDLTMITSCQIEPRISTATEINALLDKYYGTEEAMSAAEAFTKDRERQKAAFANEEEEEEVDLQSAPIVQLVKSIIEQAVRSRASDIHIDAHETQVVVRFRIDGVLKNVMSYDIELLPVIITRIKIIGGMDISEKRRAQDGRITIYVDHLEYDLRVSILPTSYGEKVVMRIASTVGLTKTKAQLGMKEAELKRFEHILSNPNGIILVTGPTGSGKSTTLYTALSELNDETVNIITVEDPVEANISGLNQVQVNPKAGLTFASALRAILRQDPDIIMIGEIRDYETASIAVQASITGHLVVSTLHTNSSAATITRLLDMGVESYLIADSVVGVIAQRLVRKLCQHCKKGRDATDEEKRILGIPVYKPFTIYDPAGCPMCSDTGFYGRTGVYEIMEITPELKRLITAKSNTEEIKNAALKDGMNTLRMSAAQYVLEGVTTITEMLKVSYET